MPKTSQQRKPRAESNRWSMPKSNPRIVSLFCGAGGLDWGFKERGYRISLAIDLSAAAIKTHKRNFPDTHAVAADLTKLGPRGVLALTRARIPEGAAIGVIGGPPCQGFSRANPLRRNSDPRNALPSLYLQIVRSLKRKYRVEFVVFENVLGMRDKRHAPKYRALLRGLKELGFVITEKELCALDFGVPQNRRRIVLSALRDGAGYAAVKPRKRRVSRTIRSVIGSIGEPAFFERTLRPEDIPIHPNHWTMKPKSPRFKSGDPKWVDGRSFKRLSWSGTSPTIAFGNREIYIHPDGTRRLSIYEAMLLQGFPHSFVLEGNLSEQVVQVSNAVPPPLARSVAAAVQKAMDVRK